MTEKYEMEIVRRIYDNEDGHFVTVGPSGDFPGNVMIYAEDSQKDWFGPYRLDLAAEFMRKLGEALIAAADEAEKSA